MATTALSLEYFMYKWVPAYQTSLSDIPMVFRNQNWEPAYEVEFLDEAASISERDFFKLVKDYAAPWPPQDEDFD